MQKGRAPTGQLLTSLRERIQALHSSRKYHMQTKHCIEVLPGDPAFIFLVATARFFAGSSSFDFVADAYPVRALVLLRASTADGYFTGRTRAPP